MCAAEKAETACETQDTPLIVPDYDCAFMERTLMEMLRLYHHPVGVTFLFSDEETEAFRQEHPDMLLFDGGDFSQGTPYYNLFRGELEVQMMNLMRYDAVTIGNHEFDFGLENMARLYRMARFPVVCANYDVKGTVLEGLVKPYVVLERGGLRIGVFGLSPQLEGLVQASRCEGVVYQDPVATAQAVVDTLRGAERCDVVICLSHLGLLGIDSEVPGDEVLAARTRGIDLILGGHTHTFLEQPAWLPDADGKHVPLMHTGKNGAYVGQLKMRLEKE